MKSRCRYIIITGICLIACFLLKPAAAQTGSGTTDHYSVPKKTWNKKKTASWYNSYKWLNGLQIKPDGSIDQQEFARQYRSHPRWWDEAFTFMKRNDLSGLAPGKYPIDGDHVFAIITERPSKDFNKTTWEAHRNYSDIHYVIKGKEKIGTAPVATAIITKAYDSTADIGFYTAEGKYYTGDQKNFFIMFPENAHRHGITADEPGMIRKLVIKVRAIQ